MIGYAVLSCMRNLPATIPLRPGGSLTVIACIGGPYDGQKVQDCGLTWRIVARVVPPKPEEPWRPAPAAVTNQGGSGTYIKRESVYRWEPD